MKTEEVEVTRPYPRSTVVSLAFQNLLFTLVLLRSPLLPLVVRSSCIVRCARLCDAVRKVPSVTDFRYRALLLLLQVIGDLGRRF